MSSKLITLCIACNQRSRGMKPLPKDTLRRNKWLVDIGRSDLLLKLMNEDVRKRHAICGRHFEDDNVDPILQSATTAHLIGATSSSLKLSKDQVEESLFTSRTASITKSDFQKLSKKFVNEDLEKLSKWQINSKDKSIENKQYSEAFMLFALSLYRTNRYVYQFLKNTLSLPTTVVVRKYSLPHATQVDQRFINVLSSRVNEMSPREKICCICVDCVPVKPGLFYDISNDRFIGFQEISGTQEQKFAKYVVVVMAQGIINGWQLPIAHCFLADFRDSKGVIDWIEEILHISIGIGFDVRAFVTDQRSKIVTPKPSNPDASVLKVGDQEICRMFDVPSLIQRLRIYLRTCHFVYNDDKILTVSYLEDKISCLGKILNCNKSKRLNLKASREDELRQLQVDFLKQMLDIFKKLKAIDNSSGIDTTDSANITEFQVTINSALQLEERLRSEGFNLTLTNRLNLDGIEKFFARVKQRFKCQKPTCRQVSMMIRKKICRIVTCKTNGGQDNLESLLKKVEDNGNINDCTAQVAINTCLAVGTADYNFVLPDKQVISYISKYLYRKCLDIHSACPELGLYLKRLRFANVLHLNRNQNVPPDGFTDYIFLLEKKIQDYFALGGHLRHVGNDILKAIQGTLIIPSNAFPCSCFPFDYALKLFIRFRLYYTVKLNNNQIKVTTFDNDLLFIVGNLITM